MLYNFYSTSQPLLLCSMCRGCSLHGRNKQRLTFLHDKIHLKAHQFACVPVCSRETQTRGMSSFPIAKRLQKHCKGFCPKMPRGLYVCASGHKHPLNHTAAQLLPAEEFAISADRYAVVGRRGRRTISETSFSVVVVPSLGCFGGTIEPWKLHICLSWGISSGTQLSFRYRDALSRLSGT